MRKPLYFFKIFILCAACAVVPEIPGLSAPEEAAPPTKEPPTVAPTPKTQTASNAQDAAKAEPQKEKKPLEKKKTTVEAETSATDKPEEGSTEPSEEFEMPEVLSPLSLGLGLGMYTLSSSKASTWRARGGSEISMSYEVASLRDHPLEVTLRYISSPVAPSFKRSDSFEDQYVGVVSAYLLGAQWNNWVQDSVALTLGVEMGVTSSTLTSSIPDTITTTSVDKTGFILVTSGGVMWEALESFSLGPRLGLGFGSFTTFQLSGNLRFSF